MENPISSQSSATGGDPVRKAGESADQSHLIDLLEQISGGDQDAFAQFYNHTSKRVYGLARRVLVDAELSRDATQEVYLQVWNSAGKYSQKSGTPLAWLMTLAHRRAVDKVRSQQSATAREARYGAAMQVPDRDDVAETVEQQLEAEAVVTCLETLTQTQQESVRMAYYGGLTYREVAEKLGAAVPTIKSRIRDGLIRLRNCLEVN